MSARWERLPAKAREKVARRQPLPRLTYRCAGAAGCGLLLTEGFRKAQEHADTHGGCRLEIVQP